MRALLLGLLCLLAVPSAAHAWYVDISITGAGRVYETTDADELDEHCTGYPEEGFSSPSTTPTGTLGASCRAGDAAGDYGHGWVVRYVAEAAAGYRFAGWQSDGRTNPGPVLCDGSGGSSSYSGAACQFATFQNLQTRARFVDDTDPAMSSLTGPNQVVNGPATFTFSAAADPTFRLFECRVGGVHEWQTCSSGRQENPASSGTYTFQVRALDWSGNRSAESTWQWTVDKVAPETSLTSGPSGVVASSSASFEFNSNESGTFICSLDDVETSCGSPKSYSGLAQGSHTFTVRARDVAGNEDPSPASRTWTVDTVAPTTTINSGPANGSRTTSTSASFSFTNNEAGTYQCKLDRPAAPGAYGACSGDGTSSYSGLTDGPYTFSVRTVDSAGNVGTAATRTWTVDATPPDTSITAGPEGPTASTSPSFSFDSTEADSTFECKLDTGSWEPCNSGTKAYSSVSEGEHTFYVRATDPGGLTDSSAASRTWIVDTVAPDTTLAASGPTGSTSSTSAGFTFSSEPGTTFRCQLDAQPVENGCTSPRNYSGLGTGEHAFKVWAVDGAGNEDATPATRTWTVTSPDPDPDPDPDTGSGTGTGTGTGGGTPPPSTGQGTADTTKPLAGLSASKRQRLRQVLKRGLKGSVKSNEAAKVRLDVLLRRKLVATTRDRVLAAPGSMKLTAKFNRKGKRALARRRSAKLILRVRVTDAAGNVTVTKKTLKLRR